MVKGFLPEVDKDDFEANNPTLRRIFKRKHGRRTQGNFSISLSLVSLSSIMSKKSLVLKSCYCRKYHTKKTLSVYRCFWFLFHNSFVLAFWYQKLNTKRNRDGRLSAIISSSRVLLPGQFFFFKAMWCL